MFKSFAKNYLGRDFAVGDIHGNFSKLKTALEAVNFDRSVDRLFSVGDIIDHGNESRQILEWLSYEWFIPVMGNHEDFAIRHATSGSIDTQFYREYGGGWFLDLPHDGQLKIAAALATFPFAIEVETSYGMVGLVHADSPYSTWQEVKDTLTNPDADSNVVGRLKKFLISSRDRFNSGDDYAIPDLSFLLVGHSVVPQKTALGNVIYIDTGASYSENDFCVVELETLR